MLSRQNVKNEPLLNCARCWTTTHAQQNISSLYWCFKNSFCVLPWLWQWHTVQQVMAMWFCVCVSVSLACWIMASSLRGVDGHLAELRNGRCRRWEEKGRTGRLTTYWWNEKSLAQPDNLPPSHLVMNGIQHWSSSSSHMALCTSVLHLSIYILHFH